MGVDNLVQIGVLDPFVRSVQPITHLFINFSCVQKNNSHAILWAALEVTSTENKTVMIPPPMRTGPITMKGSIYLFSYLNTLLDGWFEANQNYAYIIRLETNCLYNEILPKLRIEEDEGDSKEK